MTRFTPKIELFYDGIWNDHTADVYHRDPISITRGRADEGSRVDPGKCTLTLNNRDGKFSPRNPLSPLYGKIGRNTPVRVSETSLINRVVASDTFNRSVTDSWGFSPGGQGWWWSGGSAAERDVDGSAGTMTISTFDNGERHNYFTDALNGETVVSVRVDQLAPAGGLFASAAMFRRDTTGAYVAVVVTLHPDATVRIGALRTGVFYDGSNAPYATGLTYGAGTKIWTRARLVGQRLQGRVWLDGSAEPVGWNVDQDLFVSSDGSTPVAGGIGLMTQVVGTPAGPVKFSYDDLTITDPVGGIRFVGEVTSWPSRWDVDGQDVWVPVEAAGILRRLGQGDSPLGSTLTRARGGPNRNPAIVAYWPLEDEDGATQAASSLGGSPMVVTGTPTFAAYDGFISSAPVPTMGSARFVGHVPEHNTTDQIGVAVLVFVPAAALGQELVSVRTTGTASLWVVRYEGAGGDLSLTVYDTAGTQLATSGTINWNIDGKPQQLRLRIRKSGADAVCTLETAEIKATGVEGIVSWTVTATGKTVGRAVRASLAYNQGLTDVAMGHLGVSNSAEDPDGSDEPFHPFLGDLNAYGSERACQRLRRLCAEEGIAYTAIGDHDATEPMGPQRIATLLELLEEAAAAEAGVLHETRYQLGLTGRTRETLYQHNQSLIHLDRPVLALDYAAGHVSPPFEPIDDDAAVRNDVTVQRAGGSSARSVQESGPLSVHPPPAGVGRYDESVTLALHSDDQVAHHAGWQRHLGTVDEPRYPTVTVDLAANPSLIEEVTAVESGDRLTVANPPSWLPRGTVALLAYGYTETIDRYWWTWTASCAPATPWRVGVLDNAVLGRLDTDGSRLAAAVTAGATSLSVVSDGREAALNLNPRLDRDVSGWEGAGGSLIWSSVRAYDGPGSALLQPDGVSGTVRARTTLVDSPGAIGGRSYTFSAWLYRDANGARDVDISAEFFDAAGASLEFVIWTTVNVPSRAWTWIQATRTAPANTVTAQLNVNQRTTPATTDLLYVDLAVFASPPLWTTAAGEAPFDILVGGERMTVNATITGATNPQTLPVTRAVNGVSKAHPIGADVRLAEPLILAL